MSDLIPRVRTYLAGSVPRAVVVALIVVYGAFGFFLIRSDSQQNTRLIEAGQDRLVLVDYQSKLRTYERCVTSVERIEALRNIIMQLGQSNLIRPEVNELVDRELPAVSISECGPEPERPFQGEE